MEPHPLAEVKQPEAGKTSMANLFRRPVETSYAKLLQQGADQSESHVLEDSMLDNIGPQNKVVMKLPGRLNSVIGFAQCVPQSRSGT